MSETLKQRPKLLIEVHKFIMDKNNESITELVNYLFKSYSKLKIYLKNKFKIIEKKNINILDLKPILNSKIFMMETIY